MVGKRRVHPVLKPCPHENRFSHPNRFHPDMWCPNEGCKSVLEPCWFSLASALSNGRNGLYGIVFIQNNKVSMKPIYIRSSRVTRPHVDRIMPRVDTWPYSLQAEEELNKAGVKDNIGFFHRALYLKEHLLSTT